MLNVSTQGVLEGSITKNASKITHICQSAKINFIFYKNATNDRLERVAHDKKKKKKVDWTL